MKGNLDYSVGSVADLISGSTTPNKPKVVKKEIKNSPKRPQEIPQTEENDTEDTGKKRKKRSFSPKTKKQKLNESNLVEARNEEIPTGKEIISKKNRLKSPKIKQTKQNLDSEQKQDTDDSKDEFDNETKKKTENPDHTAVFIGNLPLGATHKKLEKLFSKFGKVINARIRSIPVADPKVPKKVAFIKKQFHAERKSMNGYVTFATPADAEKALVLNGAEYQGHHLRVNLSNEKLQPDKSRALFLGNVSFAAEEEELWKLFESCGEIESVRLVRDRFTDVGKGFGYINFRSADSVELALQMGEIKLKDRVLRLSLYNGNAPKKQKKQKGQKKHLKPKKEATKNGEEGNDSKKNVVMTAKHGQFQGKFAQTQKKKNFNKGNQQKKSLAKKVAPRTMAAAS